MVDTVKMKPFLFKERASTWKLHHDEFEIPVKLWEAHCLMKIRTAQIETLIEEELVRRGSITVTIDESGVYK